MKIKNIFFAGILLLAFGCKQATKNQEADLEKSADHYSTFKNKDYDDNKAVADSAVVLGNGSSSAAVENLKDTVHKFIRTADLKFEVKNVEKATYAIEDIVTAHGGFVTNTELKTNIDNRSETLVSVDSAVQTTKFTVGNFVTIRVPNIKLDTTLKDIAKLVGFLDFRIIKAEDVSLQIMANSLEQKRVAVHTQRLANDIDNKAKKLEGTPDAEENLLQNQQESDEAKMANLSLNDQQKFSTVKLELYQPQSVVTSFIAIAKPLAEYRPSFFSRLIHSLAFGWQIVEDIFIGLANFWVFILLGILAIIWFKKWNAKMLATAKISRSENIIG